MTPGHDKTAQKPPKITVRIGSLVLHDGSYAQSIPLAAALKRELGRLLASPGAGVTALTAAPARRAHLDAGSFASASAHGVPGVTGGAAATDGARIARNVYRGITGGRSP